MALRESGDGQEAATPTNTNEKSFTSIMSNESTTTVVDLSMFERFGPLRVQSGQQECHLQGVQRMPSEALSATEYFENF